MMKRSILFLALLLTTAFGWSQTVTLKFKNGTTQQYSMSELESIDFTSEESGTNQGTTSSLVGTWRVVLVEGWGQSNDTSDEETEYLQLRADGTFIDIKIMKGIIQHGTWSVYGTNLLLFMKDGLWAGNTITYTIIEEDSDKLTVNVLPLNITSYMIRVPDSEIEKYLNN